MLTRSDKISLTNQTKDTDRTAQCAAHPAETRGIIAFNGNMNRFFPPMGPFLWGLWGLKNAAFYAWPVTKGTNPLVTLQSLQRVDM